MTSILTNNGAMVALQTLNSINNNLTDTQNQISTGKKVGNAQDNSAVWAISKVMESDVQGFEAISSSLALGDSTVAVARNAAESITDALIDIKEKIIAAQEGNVDRDQLQKDVEALRDQISSIAGAAQFNGLNLLSNTDNTAGSDTMSVLGSLDRAADGSVTATNIDIRKQDLGQGASTIGSGGAVGAVTITGGAPLNNGATASYHLAAATAGAGNSYELTLTGIHASLTDTVSVVMKEGDTIQDAVETLAARANAEMADKGISGFTFTADGTDLDVTNNSGAAGAANLVLGDIALESGGTAGGGLEDLTSIDVSTSAGADSALSIVENLIETATDAAAAFGSAASRIETQSMFVSKLTDSLKSGIGSLVDADMEAASARLKALQTQQQLGVQALTIANSAPSTLQQLFR